MAVQFEFYKNPVQDEEEGEACYHPRVINSQSISTQELAAEIHAATTYGKSEVEGMLMELSQCMEHHLREGRRVHLDGIGYFQVTLQATEPIHSTTARANKVKYKSVSFQTDKKLRSKLANMHLQRSKLKPHSASLSEAEIDQKLTAYFTTHPVLTRSAMQSLCHFTRSMAARHIQRLKRLGYIENIGLYTQPIYVACPGHYERLLKKDERYLNLRRFNREKDERYPV